MTDTRTGTIDFTEMYCTHDAFRRDLDRLVAAAEAGRADAPAVRAGWANFKHQLHIHHTVEDAYLWPRLHRVAAGDKESVTLLNEMEAEHAQLDPLLAEVDLAMKTQSKDLVRQATKLAKGLGFHLKHEEDQALPYIQSVLTPKDWLGFRAAMTRAQGIRGAAVFIPWIVDDRPPADRNRFLAKMPAPARLLNRMAWEPRYQKRNLWHF